MVQDATYRGVMWELEAYSTHTVRMIEVGGVLFRTFKRVEGLKQLGWGFHLVSMCMCIVTATLPVV